MSQEAQVMEVALFPGLHSQLLSLAVRPAIVACSTPSFFRLQYCKQQKLGVEAWERGYDGGRRKVVEKVEVIDPCRLRCMEVVLF